MLPHYICGGKYQRCKDSTLECESIGYKRGVVVVKYLAKF